MDDASPRNSFDGQTKDACDNTEVFFNEARCAIHWVVPSDSILLIEVQRVFLALDCKLSLKLWIGIDVPLHSLKALQVVAPEHLLGDDRVLSNIVEFNFFAPLACVGHVVLVVFTDDAHFRKNVLQIMQDHLLDVCVSLCNKLLRGYLVETCFIAILVHVS